MSDKMMRRVLKVCAVVLFLCGVPMVVMAVMQRDARMGLYGVLSLLFAFSNVLQLLIVDDRQSAPASRVSVVFDPVVYCDPDSGRRFAVATFSNTTLLWDAISQDVVTSSDREVFWLDGWEERTSTIANALTQQQDGGHGREDR